MRHARNFYHQHGLSGIAETLRHGIIAIGNFDGLHKGHRAVLTAARNVALEKQSPALVLTFEPHPRSFFNPNAPLFRLTPQEEKALLIEALGFDGVIVLPFDGERAAQEPQAFIDTVLVEALAARHVVVGFDFHFGKDRAGTPSQLRARGRQHGFDVTIIAPYNDEQGVIVSSSRVRGLLRRGAVAEAADLLGYHWFFQAQVVHGEKRGRTLGFPTANLYLPPACGLAEGIYAVRAKRADKDSARLWDGVASFGRRPTFDNGAPLFEVFLFDVDEDLYGATLMVSLVGWMRAEQKFSCADALTVQMNKDVQAAQAYLRDAPNYRLDNVLLA